MLSGGQIFGRLASRSEAVNIYRLFIDCNIFFYFSKGAHMNPAVTLALALTRQVTPLRAALFVAAHCGGGIAGAALLYGYVVKVLNLQPLLLK